MPRFQAIAFAIATTVLTSTVCAQFPPGITPLNDDGRTPAERAHRTPEQVHRTDEVIERHDVLIDVKPDGTLDVTETIVAVALHHKIKRGIYRDFRPSTLGRYGFARHHPVDVRLVRRDGRAEPYDWTEGRHGFEPRLRLRVGDRVQAVPTGRHEYVIRYETINWITLEDGRHVLDWDAIPDHWAFPVEASLIEIRVPGDVLESDWYISGEGPAWAVSRTTPGRIVLESTRALEPEEGLALHLSWPADRVDLQLPAAALWKDDPSSTIAIIAIMASMLVYAVGWLFFGHDRRHTPHRAVDTPPSDISPGLARMLDRQKWDLGCVSAALADAAGKGCIEVNSIGGLAISRGEASWGALSEPERDLCKSLTRGGRLAFIPASGPKILNAIQEYRQALRNQAIGSLFTLNRGWCYVGAMLGFVGILASLISQTAGPGLGGGLVVCHIGVTVMVTMAVRSFSAGRRRRGSWFSAFSVPLIAVDVLATIALVSLSGIWVPLGIVLAPVATTVFWKLMPAPTNDGRKQLAEVDAYRQWFETTSPDDVARSRDEVESSIARHLPWAVALGIDTDWTERLKSLLSMAGPTGAVLTPLWDSGTLAAGICLATQHSPVGSESPIWSDGGFAGGSFGGGFSGSAGGASGGGW